MVVDAFDVSCKTKIESKGNGEVGLFYTIFRRQLAWNSTKVDALLICNVIMFTTMDMAAIFISNLLIENKCVGSKAHFFLQRARLAMREYWLRLWFKLFLESMVTNFIDMNTRCPALVHWNCNQPFSKPNKILLTDDLDRWRLCNLHLTSGYF